LREQDRMRCPHCSAVIAIVVHQEPLSDDERTITEEITEIAYKYGMSLKHVQGRDQTRATVRARAHIAHHLRDKHRLTLSVIGRILGNRDHSTMSNLLSKHPLRIVDNPGDNSVDNVSTPADAESCPQVADTLSTDLSTGEETSC